MTTHCPVYMVTRDDLIDSIGRITVYGTRVPGREHPIVSADDMADAIISTLPDSATGHRSAYDNGRKVERKTVREHLLGVITDHVRQGNDVLLGALLDAIRELETP